jgi:multidrug efflux system membrane fusion protein
VFSGRLEAVERVDIRSRVAGAVRGTHFREGALVAKGDLLITIDPAPFEAEVARAEAQAAAAQARMTHAANEQARARRLWEDKAIAQRELDDRESALREAEANLKAAQAQLQSSRLNLSYTQVRAPVAGRTGKLEVTVGNLARRTRAYHAGFGESDLRDLRCRRRNRYQRAQGPAWRRTPRPRTHSSADGYFSNK